MLIFHHTHSSDIYALECIKYLSPVTMLRVQPIVTFLNLTTYTIE